LQLSRLALQTKTTDQIEHSYPLIDPPNVSWFPSDWIELARIPSLFGKITTLRQIDTFAGTIGNVNLEYRSSGVFFSNLFEYHLIYTPINSGPRRVFNQVYPAFGELPGNPCFRLPFWNDNRYSWGNHNVNNTIPLVPGYNISLFVKFSGFNDLPPAYDTGALYQKGDLVTTGFFEVWAARVASSNGGLPNLTPNLWERIFNAGTGELFLSFAGRLFASVQDEKDLSAMYQARTTYQI
jgi:hypothetical protein